MTFEKFVKYVGQLAHKAGIKSHIKFFNDDGDYTARFSDGTVIKGRASSLKYTIRWGSGHQAMASY